MNNHEVDFAKVNQAGEDIIKLVNDCNIILEDLKKRINNIQSETKEWQGTSEIKFASIFTSDIEQYKKALKTMDAFGKQLTIDASRYQEVLKRVTL